MTTYKKLFEPITVKNVTFKNRFIMPPMATRFASFNGMVTDQMINYYTRRAEGGVGLVTLEACSVLYEGMGWRNNVAIFDDVFIPGLKKLVDSVHEKGAKISVEIFHTGRKAPEEELLRQSVAPSAIRPYGGLQPREITVPEIKNLVKAFGQAARRAKEAGFDVVNIHMAHGYIIQQFLSPLSNRRTDEYGGSTENRCRLAVEIVQEVRKQVGEDFPIFARLSADEYMGDLGVNLEESKKIVPILEKAGVDVIDITVTGSDKGYLCEATYSAEHGFNVFLAKGLKEVATVPLTIVGKIKGGQLAESILENGYADFIVVGRELIADPDYVNKLKEGREDEIMPCLSCVVGCTGRLGDASISCAVNPEVGREGLFSADKAENPKNILVIGGGVSGMNAARTLARKGHSVTLIEKDNRLGGQANLAATPRHKVKDVRPFVDFMISEMDRAGVKVVLNEEFSKDSIAKYQPEAIVQTTGASPVKFKLPGSENVNTVTAWEVLRNKECPGDTVAVIGAGEVGMETSEFLTQLGKKVYVFEMLPQIAKGMHAGEKRFFFDRIMLSDIEIWSGAKVNGFEDHKIIFEHQGIERYIDGIDTVVMAVGSRPIVLPDLEGIDIPVYQAGDTIKIGRMYEAMQSSYMIQHKLK